MSNTVRTAAQAVATARGYVSYRERMCLEWVYKCIAAPRTYLGLPDADAAWSAAKQRETTGTPPAGAPVYWAIGPHGHIALSVGNGRVRSTDWPHRGSVSECGIDELSRAWGATYRGWSRDYAGDPIPGLEKPKPAPVKKPATVTHVVKRGESLSAIGAKYGVTWNAIYNANRRVIGSNPNLIKPGQRLVIKK